ncbi:MAG: hypothetical protein ACI4EJ_05765 [Bacteroides sp.]
MEINMVYEQLVMQRTRLEEELHKIHEQLDVFPDGNLICSKNGKYTKWFKSNGSHPIYIPTSEKDLAEALAAKKYYSLQAEELSQEMHLLDFILDKFFDKAKKKPAKSKSMVEETSSYKELLEAYFQKHSDKLYEWAASDYEHNLSHPEHLIHKCIAGHNVRSKSEAIIANLLFSNKIPYRYEFAFRCESLLLYPDFTILHPQTEKIFYWEHFGMMDNNSYCENAFNKLKLYASHGILTVSQPLGFLGLSLNGITSFIALPVSVPLRSSDS